MPGAGPRSTRTASEAKEELTRLLETAYGSAEGGRAALHRALQNAMRHELPATIPEILSFVRVGLLPVLSADLGPRLTMTLVEDFVRGQEIRSGVGDKVPASTAAADHVATPGRSVHDGRLRVLLVDTDRLGRSVLARTLLREQWHVTVVDSLEELGEVVRSGDGVHVAILDGQHPAKLLFIEMLVEHFPAVSLVVRSAGEAATRMLIQALGVARFDVLPARASSESLVEAVRRVAMQG